ncbi:MAG: T9SS type A sorting domain-containing protein [Bacteroidota bacterium]
MKLYSDTVFVSASVTAAPGLFTISYPEGNKLWSYPCQIPIQFSSTSAAVGDYLVTITTTGSNGTPVHKRTATLRVVAAVSPHANFVASNTNPCAGQAVSFTDLSSGPPSSWAWTFTGATPSTSTSQNPTGIVYSAAGTYDVTLAVTNQMGTNTVTLGSYITVKPSPEPPAASNVSVCYGQPVPDLTASGTALQWYSGGTIAGTGSTFTTGQTSTGTYNYIVTQTQNGCESQPTPVSLTINELPFVYLNFLDTVCESIPAFDLSGGTPTGGTYSGQGINNGLTFDPAVAGVGNHEITYSYTDGNTCSSSFVQSITVNPLPIVTMDAISPVCVSASPILLAGTPTGGTYSGPGVSADTLYPSQAGAGIIHVAYTFIDPTTHCSATANQSITINTLPIVVINDSTVCGNRKLIYDATISNPQSYLWTPGGATTATLQIDTIGKGLGAHTYHVSVTDANGCMTADSAVITFFDCTGIPELADSKLIELFPNPSSGQFAVRGKSIPAGNYDLNVFDALGKLAYSEAGLAISDEFLHPLDLSHLPNGIYILQLKNKQTGFNKRFIINK